MFFGPGNPNKRGLVCLYIFGGAGANQGMPALPFGQYEVLARLAAGAAGQIFIARQVGAGEIAKVVCLKTLTPERAQDPDFVAAFFDEARLAARLHHPNCVQIYELGMERETYFISMEHIHGETIAGLLREARGELGPIPRPLVAAIMAGVCEGLHHAHELHGEDGAALNMVHRDVSPQNIMITYEGQTKVLDFGIAKADTGRDTKTGIIKGKAAYMSPEQITGRKVDRRADIYAVGVLLYESLALHMLYDEASPKEIAWQKHKAPLPRLSDELLDIEPELDDICAKAMAKSPVDRYQTADEMARALQAYLAKCPGTYGTAEIGRMMQARYRTRYQVRSRALDGVARGLYSEGDLFEAFGARPVMNLDLYGDAGGPTLHEFNEPLVIEGGELRRGAPAKKPLPEDDAPTIGTPQAKLTPKDDDSAAQTQTPSGPRPPAARPSPKDVEDAPSEPTPVERLKPRASSETAMELSGFVDPLQPTTQARTPLRFEDRTLQQEPGDSGGMSSLDLPDVVDEAGATEQALDEFVDETVSEMELSPPPEDTEDSTRILPVHASGEAKPLVQDRVAQAEEPVARSALPGDVSPVGATGVVQPAAALPVEQAAGGMLAGISTSMKVAMAITLIVGVVVGIAFGVVIALYAVG